MPLVWKRYAGAEGNIPDWVMLVRASRELRRNYLVSEDLGVIPRAAEENVAVVIHIVSSGNEAIYLQWPPDSPLFILHDLYGEDLQETAGQSIYWDPSICI